MKKVAVSLHATDDFKPEIIQNLKGLDYIHVDVMDGKFVKAVNLNLKIFELLKENYHIPIIAHLMINNPSQYLDQIIDYVDYCLIHFEIEEDKFPLFQKTESLNKGTGIVLNPETEVSKIEFLLDNIDIVLILGVNPGRSGQQFIPETINKINKLAQYKKSFQFLIDVDGGVNLENAAQMKNADILTSASTIMNAKDPNSVITQLKKM